MPNPASAGPEAGEALLRSTLEAHGQRCTEQRSAVYRFLSGTDQHPSADEVFTVVRGEIPDISLATVYKALETLVSCGLAVKLTYGDDSARYDARTDDHYRPRRRARRPAPLPGAAGGRGGPAARPPPPPPRGGGWGGGSAPRGSGWRG